MAKRQQTVQRAARKRKAKQRARRAKNLRQERTEAPATTPRDETTES